MEVDLVEDECVEHAFLDFIGMELGLDEVIVEPGQGFSGKEEWLAHAELEKMLCLIQRGYHEDIVVGVEGDHGGVIEDRCSTGAYYDGGTWWLDRWLLGRSENIATHVSKEGHGKSNAMAADRQTNLLSVRVVQPNQYNMGMVVTNTSMINKNYCSGYYKRCRSMRTGRWWPSSGGSWPTRCPWKSTSQAASRLRGLKDKNINDKFLKENFSWAKPVAITGAGKSSIVEDSLWTRTIPSPTSPS